MKVVVASHHACTLNSNSTKKSIARVSLYDLANIWSDLKWFSFTRRIRSLLHILFIFFLLFMLVTGSWWLLCHNSTRWFCFDQNILCRLLYIHIITLLGCAFISKLQKDRIWWRKQTRKKLITKIFHFHMHFRSVTCHIQIFQIDE
jgi:hypothetical protein